MRMALPLFVFLLLTCCGASEQSSAGSAVVSPGQSLSIDAYGDGALALVLNNRGSTALELTIDDPEAGADVDPSAFDAQGSWRRKTKGRQRILLRNPGESPVEVSFRATSTGGVGVTVGSFQGRR